MNSNKKNKTGSNQELYRICPSKLTKHELEDLYFTVLETNMQLRKTISEQQDKIKTLSTKMQRKYSAQKVYQADERKNCCIATNLKVKQQKESIEALRRAHERAAERIRNLNVKLSSSNQYPRTYPHCSSQTSSKLIRYTPSTLKQQNVAAAYIVAEEKTKNNEKVASVGNQTKWPPRRFAPSTSKQKCQSRTPSVTEKENTNSKKIESVGTLTELLRDKTVLSSNTQTEQPINKRLISADIQTELPRDKTLQSAKTQTELTRDQILRSAEIQTELPRDDMCISEITSIQTQTDQDNNNANKFYAVEYKDDTLCNENKCRTLMEELRQKINNLVEELAKTHGKYSARISRLEVEVQEYRNEKMRVRLGHPVSAQDKEPCESLTRHLLNNLRAAEAFGADLKMQLEIEKRKVIELISLIRNAKLRDRISKDVTSELESKQSYMDLERDDSTWDCNCGPDCPNKETSSKLNCKRGLNRTCCREDDTPLNSIVSEDDNADNTSQQQNFHVQKTDEDFNKCTPKSKKPRNLPDVSTNIKKDDDLPIPSKHILSDSTKGKDLCDIYNNRNPKRVSVSDDIFSKIISNVNKKSQNLPDIDKDYSNSQKIKKLSDNNEIMQSAYDTDGGEGLLDLNKIHDLPDGVKDFCEFKKNTNEPQRTTKFSGTASHCNEFDTNIGGLSEVNNNDSYRNQCLKRKQEGVNDTCHVNVDQNNTGANEHQIHSRERCLSNLSDAFESRDKPTPSLLVKSLIDMNEEQTKTVTELMHQVNDSQRSLQTASMKRTSGDNVKPNVAKDLTEDIDNITLPQDTTSLLRIISTQGKNIPSNVKNKADNVNQYCPNNSFEIRVPEKNIDMLSADLNPYDEEESQKVDNEIIKPTTKASDRQNSEQIPGIIPLSLPNQKGCMTPDANIPAAVNTYEKRTDEINKVCAVGENRSIDAITELATKYDTLPKNSENVPTKDNDFTLKRTVGEPYDINTVTTKSETKDQLASMNNIYSETGGNTALPRSLKSSDKNMQVEAEHPEKPEIRSDCKDANTIPTPTQLEIATYRRNSGTLCFKTVPVSKRSQHCQCTEQFHCQGIKNKGIQTERETESVNKIEQGTTCSTGCSKCTRNFARKSMDIQIPGNATLPESTSIPKSNKSGFKQYNSCHTTDVNRALLPAEVKEEPTRREWEKGREESRRTTSPTESTKMKEKLEAITEELMRYKKLLYESRPTVLIEATEKTQTSPANELSDEVVSEFDAGRHYVLKQGLATHTMNENNTPKCVFVLHIGTVVLSDEAVLTSRGKALALTWKFYDQDTTMTHMRAGRVVVFDFSTEYDMRLTDEFLNYMKHDELQIIICGLEEPNKPIASCSLPLRDALLNTNRRADMSLALVAGPQMVYARQVNNVASDNLDAGDEMGVLDLWCMLRADGQFLPTINKVIARTLPNQGPNASDSKRSEKPTMGTDLSKTDKVQMPQEIRSPDEYPTIRRWGSSTLRLPSRELSKDRSTDTTSRSVEDFEAPYDQGSSYSSTNDSKHRDSSGFKTPNTAEVDLGAVPPTKSTTTSSGKILKPTMKTDIVQSPATKSTAVQDDFQDDYPESMIVNEVIANIKTSDDMKRVMNRASRHSEPRILTTEANYANKAIPDDVLRNKQSETALSGLEPTFLLPRNSAASKRSDITYINQKYQDIANLYPKYNSQKNEGSRSDQSRKQVTIANHKKNRALNHDEPQKDIPEEDEQIIEIIILWLALNEECEAMLNPRVQRVYVAYEFLGRSGADLETPVSLPKPKHYVDKCYFNFKKSFHIEKKDMPLLGQLARCRAASQISKSAKDCIVFSVISEPPEDPLGLEICEDIGYAYLFLGDLLAYSNGSSGYTEVIPVRSRSGTSVCGVLAVRLDGLDVLRQSLPLVDPSVMGPRIE